MKNIYVYTTDNDLEKGWFKVGETKRKTRSRIRGQQTSNSSKLIEVFNRKTSMSDHELRDKLHLYGYPPVGDGGREWVGNFKTGEEGIEEIKLIIDRILNESNNREEIYYKERYHQYYTKLFFIIHIKRCLQKIKNGEKVSLSYLLPPRFGKTLWVMDLMVNILFKIYGFKIMLIPSYVLTVNSSFEKEFETFSDFNKTSIFIREYEYTTSEELKLIIDKYYGKKPIFLPISLHKSNFEEVYKCIKNLPRNEKFSVMDESDYGTHTDDNSKLLDVLDSGLNLFMTGTNIDKVKVKFDIDESFEMFYLDLLEMKRGEHESQKLFV